MPNYLVMYQGIDNKYIIVPESVHREQEGKVQNDVLHGIHCLISNDQYEQS